ncbi:MAG: hypothetical protein RJB66_1420 [Pseudomonadota bacterium]|jgi:hypothetical protein
MNLAPLKTLGFLALMIFSISCDRANNRRMTPPETYSPVEIKNEIAVLKNSNAVDILFVVDNSETMAVHQANLSANIDHFVKSFDSNKSIDYHIGIVPIFDSVRYGSIIKTYNPNGYLLPLNGETGKLPKFYYTREHNNLKLLANSIRIGVLPLKDKAGNYQGPEFEEILSPIYAAFNEPALSSINNKGFYRPEARLAIIMITDADDASPGISGSDLDYFLKNLKQDPRGEKISTFGVLASRTDCEKVDYGMIDNAQKVIDFLDASRGEALSLCKENFANMLTSIGKQIQNKVQHQDFLLQGVPEIGTLTVTVGGQILKPGPQTWSYDPSTNVISISFVPKSSKAEDRTVSIKYTRVNMQNIKNGRAKRIGQIRQ